MRKTKRILSAATALVMTLTFSAGAFAASYDAGSWDDLKTAFSDSSGEDVSVNLTADVNCNSSTLSTSSGKSYTINTSNGSTLKQARFYGSGSVEINTDVTGGLEATGNVSVTVNGDVSGASSGIYASGTSSVMVNGDVSSASSGVYALGNSQVTINGDVSGQDGNPDIDYSNSNAYDDGGDGVTAKDESVVTINGNVTGGNSYGTLADGGHAVVANDAATVSVSGDAIGGSVAANPATPQGKRYQRWRQWRGNESYCNGNRGRQCNWRQLQC